MTKMSMPHSCSLEHLENRTLLAADFSLVAISDTQYLCEVPGALVMNAQTQWIVDNQAAANILFVAQQGDLLRRGYSDYQAGQAQAAFAKLNGMVPYTLDIGNHDYDNQFDDLDHHISSSNFANWFGDSLYQSIPNSGFVGSSLDQRNRYHIFSANGQQYMVMSLEWAAPDPAIAWAQSVINAHRELPVILTTHEYLNSTGRTTSTLDPIGNDGQDIFTKLVQPNQQIFLVLSGHTGANRQQVSTNAAGTIVIETVNDDAGVGNFQLFTFSPDNNQLIIKTYAPGSPLSSPIGIPVTIPLDFSSRFAFATGTIANDDVFVTPQATQVVGSVLGNDLGGMGIASATTPANGSLIWSQTTPGEFAYTPNAGFHGNDTFAYTLSGGAIGVVTIKVNSPPTAVADAAGTGEGKSVVLNVVANDTDPDTGDVRVPILTTLPARGAVFANADGTFTYTPDPRFTGVDWFTYVLSDGNAVSAQATVEVNVMAAVNTIAYNYPIAESTLTGTKVGTYANLTSTDGVLETITENAANALDQRWQFNVAGGTEVTVCMNAWRAGGADEYALTYSTNGSTWLSMIQIVPASSRSITRLGTPLAGGGVGADPGQPYQMWLLPANTSGNVWIKAVQTYKTGVHPSSLAVDELFIRSTGVPLPVVSIAATDASASEVNADPGVFTVSRTGGTANSLLVSYTLGGTATNGADYIALSGTITIPAGAASATFSITPIADSITEGTETVIPTLTASPSYTLGTASATVSIADMVKPAAPTNLTATVSNRKVKLTWQDNSTNESGFHVWSSRDGVNWSLMSTVAAKSGSGSSVSFTSGNLATGVWYFKVTSYIGTLDSDPSNVVSKTV